MPTDQPFLDHLVERPIDADIGVGNFKCNPEIDWFLATVALEYHQKRISSVICWMHEEDLAGYIATSMSTVLIEDSPQREKLGLTGVIFREGGKHARQFPTLLIGMLGVCERYRRRGLAMHMLKVAVGRARAVSRDVGCRFVTVDSDRTEEAQSLYSSAGFQEIASQKRGSTVWMYFDLGPLGTAGV